MPTESLELPFTEKPVLYTTGLTIALTILPLIAFVIKFEPDGKVGAIALLMLSALTITTSTIISPLIVRKQMGYKVIDPKVIATTLLGVPLIFLGLYTGLVLEELITTLLQSLGAEMPTNLSPEQVEQNRPVLTGYADGTPRWYWDIRGYGALIGLTPGSYLSALTSFTKRKN